MVADGAGGLLEVVDRRFDRREWPISFQVPAAEAENWFRHLEFECERRGWSSAGMSQLQSRENSGSLMLLDAGVEKLSVVWDRARGEALNVRARPAADMDLSDAQECFRRTNERSSAGATERQYRWGILEYEGRAWRGELWLDDDLRLGPPSNQYEGASGGPRVVVVDAVFDCISQGTIPGRLQAVAGGVGGIPCSGGQHFIPPAAARSGLDLGADCPRDRLLGEASGICRDDEPLGLAGARDLSARSSRPSRYDPRRANSAARHRQPLAEIS